GPLARGTQVDGVIGHSAGGLVVVAEVDVVRRTDAVVGSVRRGIGGGEQEVGVALRVHHVVAHERVARRVLQRRRIGDAVVAGVRLATVGRDADEYVLVGEPVVGRVDDGVRRGLA